MTASNSNREKGYDYTDFSSPCPRNRYRSIILGLFHKLHVLVHLIFPLWFPMHFPAVSYKAYCSIKKFGGNEKIMILPN